MRRTGTAIGIALTAITLSTACSGDDGPDGRPQGLGGGAFAGGWSVEEALGELPSAAGDAFTDIRTADLERATALGELDPGGDEWAWLRGLSEDPLYVPLPESVATMLIPFEQMREELGFDLLDVGSYVAMQAVGGDAVSIEVYTLTDGDAPDSADGRVGPFDARRADDRVALSADDGILDDWADNDGSLVEDESLESLARALDEHDVYSAQIVVRSPQTLGRIDEADDRSDAPTYSSLGIGQAVEDGEEVEYVAYVVDDADEAAPVIEKLWRGDDAEGSTVSEEVRVDDVTTEAGEVVVVTIDPLQDPYPAVRMLQAGVGPFQL